MPSAASGVPGSGVPAGGMQRMCESVGAQSHADRRQRLRWWQHAWRAGLAWFIGAIFFVVILGMSPAGQEPMVDYSPAVDVLLGIDILLGQVAVTLVLLRRRWPLTIALLTMALSALSVFAVAAAMLAVLSLATRRRVGELIALVAVGVVSTLIYEAVVARTLDPSRDAFLASPISWTVVAVAFLIFGIVILAGWNIGVRRELVGSWRAQAQTAHREQTARVAQARLAERARIAREMHDVLAHRLSVVAMHAGGLVYRDDLAREEVAATAETIRANAHAALEELRELLGVLRAEDVTGAEGGGAASQAPQPGLSDIPDLVAETETQGQRVHLQALPHLWAESVSLPTSTGRHAYRVVQEALTNARKHAHGQVATVLLDGGPNTGLILRVSNPLPEGGLISSTPGSGLGLTGMSERVALAGGRLEVGHRGDQFVVDVWLPWQRETRGPLSRPERQTPVDVAAPRREDG